jgi:hypothetical protein
MRGRQTHEPENLPLAHPSLLDPLQRRTFDALQHKHAEWLHSAANLKIILSGSAIRVKLASPSLLHATR